MGLEIGCVGAQIAYCRLVLKDDHWLPVGLNAEITARYRNSPQGPVVCADIMADVADGAIVRWRSASFTVRDVGPDGSVDLIDFDEMVLAHEAEHNDLEAEEAGAVGISRRLVARSRERETARLTPPQRRAAVYRAEIQINDRLNGLRPTGVMVFRAGSG